MGILKIAASIVQLIYYIGKLGDKEFADQAVRQAKQKDRDKKTNKRQRKTLRNFRLDR